MAIVISRIRLGPDERRANPRTAASKPKLTGAEKSSCVATLPTAFGEKMVMRIFDPQVLLKSFDQLGFDGGPAALEHMIRQPNGII